MLFNCLMVDAGVVLILQNSKQSLSEGLLHRYTYVKKTVVFWDDHTVCVAETCDIYTVPYCYGKQKSAPHNNFTHGAKVKNFFLNMHKSLIYKFWWRPQAALRLQSWLCLIYMSSWCGEIEFIHLNQAMVFHQLWIIVTLSSDVSLSLIRLRRPPRWCNY